MSSQKWQNTRGPRSPSRRTCRRGYWLNIFPGLALGEVVVLLEVLWRDESVAVHPFRLVEPHVRELFTSVYLFGPAHQQTLKTVARCLCGSRQFKFKVNFNAESRT